MQYLYDNTWYAVLPSTVQVHLQLYIAVRVLDRSQGTLVVAKGQVHTCIYTYTISYLAILVYGLSVRPFFTSTDTRSCQPSTMVGSKRSSKVRSFL